MNSSNGLRLYCDFGEFCQLGNLGLDSELCTSQLIVFGLKNYTRFLFKLNLQERAS